jgi:hypothetical protein
MTTANSTSVNQDHQLSVSTRFTEGYLKARPVSGGAEITTFLDATGELDVYSVGTGNSVYHLQPKSGEPRAWEERELGITARQLDLYPGPDDDLDHPDIFGLDDENRLTLSRWDSVGGAYRQEVTQPPLAERPIAQLVSTKSETSGNVYVNVLFDDGKVGHSFLEPDGSWASDDWVSFKEREGSSDDATAKRLTMAQNAPGLRSLFGIGIDDRVVFCELPNRFAHWTPVGDLRAVDIDVIRDQDGLLNLFAVDTEQNLWVAPQKRFTTGLEFESWQRLSQGAKLATLQAAINFEDLLEVFAIGVDGLLYHLRQVAGTRGATWGTLFPLGNPVANSVFTVGRGADGYTQVYSVTQGNDLFRFWQNPISTQWSNYRIPLEDGGQIVQVANHSTEITVLDPAGVPVP